MTAGNTQHIMTSNSIPQASLAALPTGRHCSTCFYQVVFVPESDGSISSFCCGEEIFYSRDGAVIFDNTISEQEVEALASVAD